MFSRGMLFVLSMLGNTVLHMLVIHNKLDMFDLVLSMVEDTMSDPDLLHIKNNKGIPYNIEISNTNP